MFIHGVARAEDHRKGSAIVAHGGNGFRIDGNQFRVHNANLVSLTFVGVVNLHGLLTTLVSSRRFPEHLGTEEMPLGSCACPLSPPLHRRF